MDEPLFIAKFDESFREKLRDVLSRATYRGIVVEPLTVEPILILTPSDVRLLLDWRMCSDPFPSGLDLAANDALLNRLAKAMGYADWVEAYHGLDTTQ